MTTLGLLVMLAGGLLVYWALGGGSLDLTTGKAKPS